MSYTPRHESGKSYNNASQNASAGSKQKIIVYSVVGVLIAVALIALVFILTSGGNNGTVVHTEGNRHDVTVAANGGANGNEFEGLWKLDDITSYEFDGSGRGVIHTAKDFKFSYSADNGSLFIDIDTDDGRDSEYKYTIDGLIMTLSRGDATYILTKQI